MPVGRLGKARKIDSAALPGSGCAKINMASVENGSRITFARRMDDRSPIVGIWRMAPNLPGVPPNKRRRKTNQHQRMAGGEMRNRMQNRRSSQNTANALASKAGGPLAASRNSSTETFLAVALLRSGVFTATKRRISDRIQEIRGEVGDPQSPTMLIH